MYPIIMREALDHLEQVYQGWLKMKLTTDAERELASLKLQMIKEARERIRRDDEEIDRLVAEGEARSERLEDRRHER